MCVSGKAAFVGYGAVMSYFNVMGKMDIFHNKTVVAHSGRLAFADSPVHSDILAAHEVIAYPNPGLFIPEGDILGFSSYDGVIEDCAA